MGQSPKDDDLPSSHGRASEPDGFESPPEATVGMVIGARFLVRGVLGSGAMAHVYLARDSHAKKGEPNEVAVKVLHRRKIHDVEVVARFRREIEIIAQLGHPSFVRVIAFEEDPAQRPWFAMEYVDGETLQERIARGPLSVLEALPILDHVARGLMAAHEAGVVHRDLKPENILLTRDPKRPVRVVDFGLSRFAKAEKLTGQGTIIGTPRFMAPETLTSGVTADARADIFSLGAIFFETITGRSVYPAEDLAQLAGCILMGRTRRLEDIDPALAPFEIAVRKAMARDPKDRYQAAIEFSEDVRHIADLSGRFPAVGGVGNDSLPPELTQVDAALARKILTAAGKPSPKSSQGVSTDGSLKLGVHAPLRLSPNSVEFSRPEAAHKVAAVPAQANTFWLLLAVAMVIVTLFGLYLFSR